MALEISLAVFYELGCPIEKPDAKIAVAKTCCLWAISETKQSEAKLDEITSNQVTKHTKCLTIVF